MPTFDYQALPKAVFEEQEIYTDYDGGHGQHVKHDTCLSAHSMRNARSCAAPAIGQDLLSTGHDSSRTGYARVCSAPASRASFVEELIYPPRVVLSSHGKKLAKAGRGMRGMRNERA